MQESRGLQHVVNRGLHQEQAQVLGAQPGHAGEDGVETRQAGKGRAVGETNQARRHDGIGFDERRNLGERKVHPGPASPTPAPQPWHGGQLQGVVLDGGQNALFYPRGHVAGQCHLALQGYQGRATDFGRSFPHEFPWLVGPLGARALEFVESGWCG